MLEASNFCVLHKVHVKCERCASGKDSECPCFHWKVSYTKYLKRFLLTCIGCLY